MRENIPSCRSFFFTAIRVCIPLLALLHPFRGNAQQVVITEIMAAPRSGEAEWVEIHNLSSQAVDLKDCTIHDATGKLLPVSDRSRLLHPDARLVLSEHWPPGDRWDIPPDSVLVPDRLPSLNNSGDDIVLCRAEGTVLDSIHYAGSWLGDRGVSLERIHPDRPHAKENWAPCTDPSGATPGRSNSVAPPPFDLRLREASVHGDSIQLQIENRGTARPSSAEVKILLTAADRQPRVLLRGEFPPPEPASFKTVAYPLPSISPGRHVLLAVLDCPEDMRTANDSLLFSVHVPLRRHALLINEIMFEPLHESCEWIEVLNVSQEGVDISGFTLAGAPGYSGERSRLHLPEGIHTVPPGGYAVVAADSSVMTRFPMLSETGGKAMLITLGRSSLGLGNSDDDILLLDYDDRVIDSLHYSQEAHHPFLASTAGCSLELIHPSLHGSGMNGWGSCTDAPGGTPGRQNSIHSAIPPDARQDRTRITVTPLPFSPDGDGFEDYCVISCTAASAVNQMRLRLFDVNGRLVRTLRSNAPAGRRIDVIWDGLDEEGRRVRIGPYVALLELLDTADDTVSAARGIVVVAVRL